VSAVRRGMADSIGRYLPIDKRPTRSQSDHGGM
jgi:hypothetical protein